MHVCILVLSTVATDALVLKHQAISIHSADRIFIVLDWFLIRRLYMYYCEQSENEITFWTNVARTSAAMILIM